MKEINTLDEISDVAFCTILDKIPDCEYVTKNIICDFLLGALELIDKATLFSKNDVLEEYEKHKNDENIEKILLEKSIDRNGEQLGFYNTSKYTLKDILYHEEIKDTYWLGIKSMFEIDYENANKSLSYFEKQKEFEAYLNMYDERDILQYKEFEQKLKEKYIEYLRGFSENVKNLLNTDGIFRDIFYAIKCKLNDAHGQINKFYTIPEKFIDDTVFNKYHFLFHFNMDTGEYMYNPISKDCLYSVLLKAIENLLNLNERYINYHDLKDFLVGVLFEGNEIKQDTTILHVFPETPFIFSCLDYMRNKNPECQVHICILTPKKNYMHLLLKLLNIISYNVKIECFSDFSHGQELLFTYMDHLHKKHNSFDYIIHSNFSVIDLWQCGYGTPKEPFQVSSRIMYIGPFNNGIYDYWLKKDRLESLILIPFENTVYDSPIKKEDMFNLGLVTTLNFNKSKKQKNKFLCVDKNLNYDITPNNSIEDSRSMIRDNEIYEGSLRLFSEFIDSDDSKIFNIENYLDENHYNWRHRLWDDTKYTSPVFRKLVDFNFNDEMYDVKMKSQKKYLEMSSIEDDKRITTNLDYPIEKLGSLVEDITNSDIDPPTFEYNEIWSTNLRLYALDIWKTLVVNREPHLYIVDDTKYSDQIAFLNSEVEDNSKFCIYKIISEKVSLQYLYCYLNSEMGKNEFFYHLRGHDKINEDYDKDKPYHHFRGLYKPNEDIYNIRVPVPPKEDQDKIVESMNRSDELFEQMKQLKTTLDKNFFNHAGNLNAVEEFFGKNEYNEETQELSIPNNWEYIHSGLIWPLAITYLLATSGGFEKVEKANNLLRLFEFTVAFNSYVLISGIPDEIYEKNKTRIWEHAYDKRDNDEKYAKRLNLSFGSWNHFHGILTGIYKKEFSTEINKEFYMNLLDKKIREKYTNLKDERNEQFHGGISNAYEAETLLNELNAPKLEIFNHLNSCYDKFRLYYTTGRSYTKTKEKIKEWEIIFLNGPYSMPIYSTIITEEDLESESLYLHDIRENKFTKLNDNLIKFKAVDEMKHDWRLYIFIGFETDKNGNKKAKYRCYQRKEEDLLEDINLNELM